MSRLDYHGQRSPEQAGKAFMRRILGAAVAGFPGSILLALGVYSLAHPAAAVHPVLGNRNVAISLAVAGAMTLIWALFRVMMSSRELLRRARAIQESETAMTRDENC